MKKRFICLGLVCTALAVSCQMQEQGGISGEVDVQVTAGIPGSLTTYADPDPEVAAFSHLGGAVNVDPAQYDLRYILEVYTDDANPKRVYRAVQIVPDNFTTQGVTFSARLIAKSYKFVFWADFVAEGSTPEEVDDLYYSAGDLSRIAYTQAVTPAVLATDAADAYTQVERVDLSTSKTIGDVRLIRPFGKIRLVATDRLQDGAVQEEYPETVTLDFGTLGVPSEYDALNARVPQDASTLALSTVTFEAVAEKARVEETDYPGAYLLGFNYFFAADGNPSYAMDVTVFDQNGIDIGRRSLSAIPVVKNRLTTVIGNFYTNVGTLTVIVEDEFDGETTVKPNEDAVAELQAALEAGGSVKLEQDIDLSASGLSIPAGVEARLDLNGRKITAYNAAGKNIKVYGDLTITDATGSGRIEATADYGPQTGYGLVEVAGENAHLTMAGGNIYAVRNDPVNKGQFGVTVSEGGDFTMTGGRIEAGWYAVSGNGNHTQTNSVIRIEGGELISVSDYAVYLPHAGETFISGGTVNGAAGAVSIRRGELTVSDNAKLYSANDGDTGNWGDGTGNQGNYGILVDPAYGACTVTVNGGEVRTVKEALKFNASARYASESSLSVKAGTFSDPTPTAFLAAEADVKVEMERDFDGAGIGIYYNGNGSRATLDIDLGGHEWILDNTLEGSQGTVSQNFHLEKDANVTIKNGTIRPGNDCSATMLFQNYSNLTLENLQVYSYSADRSKVIPYLMSNNNGNVVIRDTRLEAADRAAFAFDVYSFASYEGVTVTVEGDSYILGEVQFGGNNGRKSGKLIVNGGTFDGNLTVTPAYYDETNPNIVLNDGTFNGTGWEDYRK